MKRLGWLMILTGMTLIQTGCQKGSAEPVVLQNTRPYTPRSTLAPQSMVPLSSGLAMHPAAAAPDVKSPTMEKPPPSSTVKPETSSKPSNTEAPKRERTEAPAPAKKGSDLAIYDGPDEVVPAPTVGEGGFSGTRFGSTSKLQFKKPNLPSNLPSWFAEWDADGDGMVMLHECPKDKRDEFRKYDIDGDGIITIEEAERTLPRQPKVEASTTSTTMSATPSAPTATPTAPSNITWSPDIDDETKRSAERTMDRFAKKTPGKLAQDELPFFLPKDRFAEFDTNKDTVLDHNELAHFLKGLRGNRGGGRGDGGRGDFRGGGDGGNFGGGRGDFRSGGNNNFGGGQGGPGGGRGDFRGGNADEMNKRMFERLNKKGDGKMTRDEWPTFWPKERFDEYDTNKDGVVSLEEFKAGMTSRFQRGGR